MRYFTATLAASLLATATAFSPSTLPHKRTSRRAVLSRATIAPEGATQEAPPQREAPGAGWVPEWENRQGKSPDEFLKSDPSKPDLSEMWECPLTRWDHDGCVQLEFR